MIEIKDLKFTAGDTKIIDGLNLNIGVGEVHIIIGSNGSGKTSLAQILVGNPSYQAYSGEILVNLGNFYSKDNNPINIDSLPIELRSKIGLFLAYQNPIDLPGIAPISYLKTIANEHKKYRGEVEYLSKDFLDLIDGLVSKYKFSKKIIQRSFIEGISGGEKKMFELMQMLLLDPKLIILDEIDSGLDLDALNRFYKIFESSNRKDKSWIIISHNPEFIKKLNPTQVHIMQNGKIVRSGQLEVLENIIQSGFNQYV